jgi:hypothetical protein
MKAWGKETSEASLESRRPTQKKTNAGLEDVKAAMDVFEERLDKMHTTDLEVNREKSGALAVH